jgi:hypothetical protein
MLLIGERKEKSVWLHPLRIGISFVNGSMVVTMYGVRLLVGWVQTLGRQNVTVGDGFGSNFTVILSWLKSLWLLDSHDIHQY